MIWRNSTDIVICRNAFILKKYLSNLQKVYNVRIFGHQDIVPKLPLYF